jgi:DNA-binding transcriptional MerR regulator
MKQYPLAIYCNHDEPQFELGTAAELARVSEDFIYRCDREGLVTSRVMLHGKKGLCFSDVCKLKLVRHLHEDMGFDLEAVDLVVRYRNQIRTMQRRFDELEQRLRQKDQEHHIEILALRRQSAQIWDDD